MSDQVTHRQIEELLGAFALDAVDEDERNLVEAHLAGCPRCRAEVAGYREMAALMAHPGTRAPEGVWSRIAASIEGEQPPELDLPDPPPVTPLGAARAKRDVSGPGSRRVGRSISVRLASAITAVAAALSALLGVGLATRDDDTGAVPGDPLLQAALAAMADPDAQTVSLESFDGARGARVVRLPDGTGYLVSEGLRALPDDRTYQLWGLDGDAAVSLAVLGNNPKVSSFTMVGPVKGFAVTEERAGGVVSSEASPVVVGWAEEPEDDPAASPGTTT